jgi:hypothetical protein
MFCPDCGTSLVPPADWLSPAYHHCGAYKMMGYILHFLHQQPTQVGKQYDDRLSTLGIPMGLQLKARKRGAPTVEMSQCSDGGARCFLFCGGSRDGSCCFLQFDQSCLQAKPRAAPTAVGSVMYKTVAFAYDSPAQCTAHTPL